MTLMIRLIQGVIDMKLMISWVVTSSALILIVLAARYLFRNRLSARLRYALWGVVLLRLLVPFQVELPAAVPLPVLASNVAQDIAPRLDDAMLYAIPTEDQPGGRMPEGLPPQYVRNGFPDRGWEYYSGGVVYDGSRITRYAFMMSALEVLVLTWIAGTVLAASVILLSNLRFGLRLRKRRVLAGGLRPPLQDIPVYVAEGLPSPCLAGVFRPAVYIPPETAENPDTLRHVLAHELTHYRHRDHIWSTLRCLALALHWHNPLVWLAVGLSKQDGELACDEGAVERLGEAERIPYGRTLVDMVAKRSLRPGDLLSCSTAMTGGKKSIQQRVAQIVKKPETVKTALFAAVAVVALSAVFTFAGRRDTSANPVELDTFLSQAGEAQCIFLGNPLISSQSPPGPITSPEGLAQAREILSKPAQTAALEDGSWRLLSFSSVSSDTDTISREQLERQFASGGCPLNLFPTSERREEDAGRFWLVPWHTRSLLLRWDAQREGEEFQLLGHYPYSSLSQLKELARTDGLDQSALRGDLTQEQIDRANEAFQPNVPLPDGSYGFSEISCFFTSSYNDPTQIDLEQFLMYCPLAEILENDEAEEFQAVMKKDGSWNDWEYELNSPGDLPVPTKRYPREKVSALLQKYAGVTIDQLDWGDMLYLEEYDAFYNFTSDAGPGFFPCAGGQIMDGTVLLWSEPDGSGDRCELVLRKSGESWLIQSHHTIYER
ncbi:MAG: M56 family metallopeptidase [Lawsonibacter sp.]|nr:M56 family metallopeptidase [Lawsonibacter sp.]